MPTDAEARRAPRINTAKRDRIRSTIAHLRDHRFCGPSDDPDEQFAVTAGYRHLVVQLQRLASPILPEAAAFRLNALDVEVNNIFSAFDVKAEIDALLPDIEDILNSLDAAQAASLPTPAKPLPVPLCSIVGHVLGSFIYNHCALETLFYEAGAVGEAPEGNCVVKCQAWLKRMHIDVSDPVVVLGKILEEFMEVDGSAAQEEQQAGRKRIHAALGQSHLLYRRGGLVVRADIALSTKSLNRVLKDRDLAGVDKEFERALANVENDPPAAITAACSILESLFKVYIEDTGAVMPKDQSLKPLWKTASKHLGLDPSSIEDDDVNPDHAPRCPIQVEKQEPPYGKSAVFTGVLTTTEAPA